MNKNCIIEIKDFEFEIKGNPNLNYGFGFYNDIYLFFSFENEQVNLRGKMGKKDNRGRKKNEREMKRKKKKGRK